MPLSRGELIGPYEILALLGAGCRGGNPGAPMAMAFDFGCTGHGLADGRGAVLAKTG